MDKLLNKNYLISHTPEGMKVFLVITKEIHNEKIQEIAENLGIHIEELRGKSKYLPEQDVPKSHKAYELLEVEENHIDSQLEQLRQALDDEL